MKVIFVVHQLRDWPHEIDGASTLTARSYLTEASDDESEPPPVVVNLCRSYRYQSRGYYVSLLAEARGHRAFPEVKTIEDLNSVRLTELLRETRDPASAGHPPASQQPSPATARADTGATAAGGCDVDAYFGCDPSGRHVELARRLFEATRVPLLRVRFEPGEDGAPRIARLRAMVPTEVPLERHAFLVEAAKAFAGARRITPRFRPARVDSPSLAILHDPSNPDPPSNPGAIAKFVETAASLGVHCEVIGRDAAARIAEFDALFIRDTTSVNHYTYEFSRRAAAAGRVVIDDPDSILKCTNKVYLHEVLSRNRIPTPRTLMVDRENVHAIVPALGLPCVLKQPDSAFSLGVKKVHDEDELARVVAGMLEKSELIVAQEFLPTAFDWRVGVLDGRAIFACKYFMAPGHWQVIKREPRPRGRDKVEGRTVAVPVEEAPREVIDTAVRAAALIGNGLYGVDLKQVGSTCYVIEINDNPNVDAGNEDAVLHDALYREIVGVLLRRVRERRLLPAQGTAG